LLYTITSFDFKYKFLLLHDFYLKKMNKKSKYTISFGSLTVGKYAFSLSIEDDFFELFADNELGIEKGQVSVQVELTKYNTHLVFDFSIKGEIEVVCDRCLDNFRLPIKGKEKLYVKFGEFDSDITDIDDTMVLKHGSSEIDLAQHLFEYICLRKPVRCVHPLDKNGKSQCNEDMIKKLQNYLSESPREDARWNKLQNLVNNN